MAILLPLGVEWKGKAVRVTGKSRKGYPHWGEDEGASRFLRLDRIHSPFGVVRQCIGSESKSNAFEEGLGTTSSQGSGLEEGALTFPPDGESVVNQALTRESARPSTCMKETGVPRGNLLNANDYTRLRAQDIEWESTRCKV